MGKSWFTTHLIHEDAVSVHVRTRNHQDHATRAMQFVHVLGFLESAPFAWASLPFNLPVVTVSYSGRIFSHHLYIIVAKTDLVFPFSL